MFVTGFGSGMELEIEIEDALRAGDGEMEESAPVL
jgi:hypothetical protein